MRPYTDIDAEAADFAAQICRKCGEICDGSCSRTPPIDETTDESKG